MVPLRRNLAVLRLVESIRNCLITFTTTLGPLLWKTPTDLRPAYITEIRYYIVGPLAQITIIRIAQKISRQLCLGEVKKVVMTMSTKVMVIGMIIGMDTIITKKIVIITTEITITAERNNQEFLFLLTPIC